MNAHYILAVCARIAGAYEGELLITLARNRAAEVGGRIPAGEMLESLRELHAQWRLRFIDEPLTTRLMITDPSAPGRF